MLIEELQQRHAIADRVTFLADAEGAPLVRLTAAGGQALVSLKGAQVLSFVPTGQSDLLWMSPLARLAGGEPIRGGIPVCWPWFAAHPTERTKPQHGFVRTALWSVAEAYASETLGSVSVKFQLATGPQFHTQWPFDATVSLTVEAGDTLALSLETINTGRRAFDLTQALHTYFHVGDITRTTVLGLDRTVYIDKLQNFARKRQAGPVIVDGEIDRIFLGTTGATTIRDSELDRSIAISKHGSSSTVVWNPGAHRAALLGDFGPEGWRRMLCVETTNAGDDVVRLEAGARHVLGATYKLEAAASR